MTAKRDEVLAWARALCEGGATAAARRRLDRRPLGLPFVLTPLERRIVELLYAVERSLAVAEAGREAGGWTVERLRALLGEETDAALSPLRPLRRHALVAVGQGGPPAADDVVRLAPGLAARLDGAPEPEALWLGTARIAPGSAARLPPAVAGLIERFDPAASVLWTVDACPPSEAHALARGLAHTLGRGLLWVDGALAATAPDPALLLACARREADCEGDALFISQAAVLGARWRALLAPGAALLVLADAAEVPEPVATVPFLVHRISLRPPPSPVAQPDDGLDEVRRLAIRDAERALGVLRAPARPAGGGTAAPAAKTPVAPPASGAGGLAPTQAASLSEPTPSRAPLEDAGARGVASPSVPKRRSAKGAQHFGGQFADVSPIEPPSRPVAPAVPAGVPAGDDEAALPLSPDASVDELARIAATSPSAAQRIELITRLGTVKSAAVVTALRVNAQSAHPGVRAAAEAAMALLFGPNWHVSRPVARPVQPPPSDGTPPQES